MQEENTNFKPFTLDWDPEFKEESLAAVRESEKFSISITSLPLEIKNSKDCWIVEHPDWVYGAEVPLVFVRAELREWGLKFTYSFGGAIGILTRSEIEIIYFKDLDLDLVKLDLSVIQLPLMLFGFHSEDSLFSIKNLGLLRNLRYLDLSGCYGLTSLDGLCELKELEVLNLSGCQHFTEFSAVSSMNKLVKLGLSNIGIRSTDFMRDLKNLSDLKLSQCEGLTCLNGVSELQELKHLDLTGCKNLTDFSAVSSNKKLITLCLSNSGVNSMDFLRSLERLQEQESLDLNGCKNLTDVSAISSMKRLVKLNFGSCERLTCLDGLSELRELKLLDLSGCKNLTDVSALSSLKNLRDLDLSECEGLTSLNGLSELQELENLNLKGCKNLTDVSALASMKKLRDLKLGGWKGLISLDSLPDVRELNLLDLSGCKNLTDVSALSSLKNLRGLKMGGCEGLTSLGSLSVLRELKFLDLSSCKNLSDVSALSSLNNLRDLKLGGCEGLTRLGNLSGLQALNGLDLNRCENLINIFDISSLKNLERLNLYGCRLVEVLNLSFLFEFESLKEFNFHKDELFSHAVLLSASIKRSDTEGVNSHWKKWLYDCCIGEDYRLASLLFQAKLGMFIEDGESSMKLLSRFYTFSKENAEFWFQSLMEFGEADYEKLDEWLHDKLKEDGKLRVDFLTGFLDFLSSPSKTDCRWVELLNKILSSLSTADLVHFGPRICLAFRAMGEEKLASEWLRKLTDLEGVSFRDEVLKVYAEQDIKNGELESARKVLNEIETVELADQIRRRLARALAKDVPEEAGQLLSKILNENDKLELASELQDERSFLSLESNIERLLLIQASDRERFAELIEAILQHDPKNSWVLALKKHLIPDEQQHSGIDVKTAKEEFLRDLIANQLIDFSKVGEASALLKN